MTMTGENTVVLTRERYEELLESENFLTCLENAGVDNWSGYPYAMELFREEDGG